MRRISVIAITAASLLTAGLPATALAARPDNMHDSLVDLACEGLTIDGGTVSFYVGVSSTYGGYVDLRFWEAPNDPLETDPSWISTWGQDAVISPGGDVLTATFNLVEYEFVDEWEMPYGDEVGTAALTATLTAVDEPEAYSSSGRDGNRLYSFAGSTQPLAAEGRLELPGGLVFDDLTGCSAARHTSDVFMTNPRTSISEWGEQFLSCYWSSETSTVSLTAIDYGQASYSEMWVADAGGFASGYTETPVFTTRAFAAEFVLTAHDEATETVDVVGSADAAAEIAAGGRFSDLHREGDTKVRVSGQNLLVGGTLSVETAAGSQDLTMDDQSCFSQAVDYQTITTNPTTGRGLIPANDAPESAVALEAGDSVRVRTSGASEWPEASCVVDEAEYGQIEIPLGKTVWYAVAGTGGEVTIETAGSDFDTVLGVYTGDEMGLSQVACVDDVYGEATFSLQASVTFTTEPGVTYYVQAGGYAAASGTLRLAVH